MEAADRLAEYVRTLEGFQIVSDIDGNYAHMGATLTDAVLQAGVKYETVVRPRVKRMLANHPEARTTSGFLRLSEDRGLEALLEWKGGRKIETLRVLTRLLASEGVETEDELREWLRRPGNLARLHSIKGIKDKTAHYIQILVGEQTVAIDRHLLQFVADAGLPASNYAEAHTLISQAAGCLGVDSAVLDHSIWRYMSQRATRAPRKPCE